MSKIRITSKMFSLNWHDASRGLIMAVISSSLAFIETNIEAGTFTFHWRSILLTGVSGGIAYLIKNYFQPAQIKQDISPEQVDALKTSADTAAK